MVCTIFSKSEWASMRQTAPGVSYTSRDLRPTVLSSMWSTIPTPASPAMRFRCTIMSTGSISCPSTATGTPPLNVMSRYVGSWGRSSVRVQMKASEGGSVKGSSSTPPSMARPHRFWSMLKRLATFSTSTPCSAAYLISAGRSRFLSRMGASIGRSEPDINARSNLTWSFPLPEQPWARAEAPSARATSSTFRAIRGRAKAVAKQYLP